MIRLNRGQLFGVLVHAPHRQDRSHCSSRPIRVAISGLSRRSLWLGERFWEWSPHILASLQPRQHGVLHLMDRLFLCLAECRTAGQVWGDRDKTLIGIAPEHFHEILTYARHISLPFRQVVWLDKA